MVIEFISFHLTMAALKGMTGHWRIGTFQLFLNIRVATEKYCIIVCGSASGEERKVLCHSDQVDDGQLDRLAVFTGNHVDFILIQTLENVLYSSF